MFTLFWSETMRRKACFAIASCVVAVAAIGYLRGQQPAEQPAAGTAGQENAADMAAIKKAGQSFLKAYMAGDAKAMAAHWTENGEYFADDGTVLRKRAVIEKAYGELFAKKKGPIDAAIDITSIRFPSKDTAIEEGYFKVRTGNEAPVASKYTVLHVREGGKWLMAVVREWPDQGISLKDLDWLIGTWEAKRDDVEVYATYEWWGDKAFLRAFLTIKQKAETSKGFQMIGKDRSTGQLRSWTFDEEGSFGEATWTREGSKWVQEATAVDENGSVQKATHILTWIDNDAFTFQSVQRTLDGEATPNIAPIRVTRVKTK
jgi:uncharacterized protein (TIGR02246 family)